MNPDMGDGAGMKDNILKLKSLFLGMERYLTHGIAEAKSSGQKLGTYGQETGEPDLESQLVDGDEVFDPCYIQFDFRCHPSTPRVVLDYVFGSEEYPVRVSSIMNWCIQSSKESTRRRVVDNARK